MITMAEQRRDAVIDVREIPPIGHAEAMRLAESECERMLDLVRRLEVTDWSQPTDCTEWSVREIVVHQLGEAPSLRSVRWSISSAPPVACRRP